MENYKIETVVKHLHNFEDYTEIDGYEVDIYVNDIKGNLLFNIGFECSNMSVYIPHLHNMKRHLNDLSEICIKFNDLTIAKHSNYMISFEMTDGGSIISKFYLKINDEIETMLNELIDYKTEKPTYLFMD